MNRLINQLDWIFDYYVAYFMYNPNKIDVYYKYMFDKWNVNLNTKFEKQTENFDTLEDFTKNRPTGSFQQLEERHELA